MSKWQAPQIEVAYIVWKPNGQDAFLAPVCNPRCRRSWFDGWLPEQGWVSGPASQTGERVKLVEYGLDECTYCGTPLRVTDDGQPEVGEVQP